LWNSHKGSTPPNNRHSFIPLRFTGNLNRLRERVPVAVAIVHAAYESTEFVWRGRSDSHWEALHSGWWKGFLSHVIKPLRTTACASDSQRRVGSGGTSRQNRCAGFSFRAQGVGFISDHIKVS